MDYRFSAKTSTYRMSQPPRSTQRFKAQTLDGGSNSQAQSPGLVRKRSRPSIRYPYHTWVCQTVCVYDGFEDFLPIATSLLEKPHPPTMLITGHGSDPSRIFPTFANIAIVSPRHAFVPILLQQST